ncbi:MAG: hypothetical protein ACLQO1_00405 [Steroidobacteraceae bacterium]
MDRRRFCLSGAAAAISLGVGGSYASAAPIPTAVGFAGDAIALGTILFDSRFASSRAFGAAAKSAGRETTALQGDVTGVWRHHLRPQWAGGGAIAGMTTAASLFCLEQLAKDHWMRVVVRVEHRGSPPGALAHRVTAAQPMLSRTCDALMNARDWPGHDWPGHDWPHQLIGVLTSCVRAKDQPRLTRLASSPKRSSREERGSPAAEAGLVSWIIAA